ncbi:MAG: DNA mismatch repair protein MutS [Lutimonas sp.]
MKQYNSIKVKYPDAVLLFRVGDFYETFGEDAKVAAGILGIVLTKRGSGSESETALAGFPHHSLNTYLPKLVKAGLRVAICDQLEDPKLTKKIVKRGVTELVTPGVSMNDEVLQSKKNNFLCALHFDRKKLGVSFLDVSTGEFFCSEGDADQIDKLLQSFGPSEVLVEKKHKKTFLERFGNGFYTFYLDDWIFREDASNDILNSHFKVSSLKGFGVHELKAGRIAAGVALHYLAETEHNKLEHITSIHRLMEEQYVWMDRFTMHNLELQHPSSPGGVSLLDIIDRTVSPMGSRMMKRWLALPLKNSERIRNRHEIVKFLIQNQDLREFLKEHMDAMSDFERLISKVATGRIGPREVVMLKDSLARIPDIRNRAQLSEQHPFQDLIGQLDNCDELVDKVSLTLQQDAPVNIGKGNAIRSGVSDELDELRQISTSGKQYLDELVDREIERTGISSLKIAFNNVFGYYIEVRNTHKDKVPEEWVRKQTLVSAERYITEELKEYEAKILGAQEKISDLEQRIYNEIVSYMVPYIGRIQKNAAVIAQIDCLCSFAVLALQNNYVRPVVDESTEIEISLGRHPVIEKQLPPGEGYIANDVILNQNMQQIIMITGPNMSGKSAILRQTALIVLLAQIGSYVPAQNARIGIVDRIFTRVGASDNISMGESTFMVEMNETANILNNLSGRSLILLDEIGRGTSTYDGISIAWAIAEYLHEHPTRAKTLFATHYHELNDMSESFERIKNFNVSVRELKDKVIFLRKLVPGGSKHSFGIHVAKLAGMPGPVLHRANKMLKHLEKSHASEEIQEKLKNASAQDIQLSFINLDDPLLEDIKDEILSTDIDSLTPIEALMKLNEIKRMLTKNKSQKN